ncbi:DUF2934 domain-containing protein [Rhizobium tubonense]|uniref:DUF2934 domain-containing protein n=1 Tax=Rhizobium tubonense TaxID=484088 RepID=UPI0018A86A8A|nr:DUF2934 domain-containing protein [Rhizobium tubonense]
MEKFLGEGRSPVDFQACGERYLFVNVAVSQVRPSLTEISMKYSDDEQLRRRAYSIWERQGCPHGKDDEIWELAVKEMNGQSAPQIDQGEWPKAQKTKPRNVEN